MTIADACGKLGTGHAEVVGVPAPPETEALLDPVGEAHLGVERRALVGRNRFRHGVARYPQVRLRIACMFAALGMDVGADTFDLSFHEPPLSERSGQPMMLGMGDPVAGPLLGLFYDAPSTPEQLAGPPDLAPAHSHSCDNFRICMKGELIVGQERYHHGEFRLQQSGRPYGQDGDAPHVDGNWRIIFFADRRGHLVRPTNPEIRASTAPRRRRSASATATCSPNCSTTTTVAWSAWSPTSPRR